MKLEPLIFEPKLVPKIWGGRKLAAWGKRLPEGVAVGESWDVYDRPQESARVARGAFKGQTLSALMAEFGPALLGQRLFEQSPPRFPLMVKIIDANEALSVQVHPDDGQALRMVGPHELGKTEMWVVLEAEPGARMTAGLKPGTTRQSYLQALKDQKLERVLNEFEVKAGDMIFVPSGRVHAIGKGCLVAEIQQNSDTTWRLYDYNRLENGKPRELHLSQGLECIRFDAEMLGMPSLQAPPLVQCPYFSVSRLELTSSFSPPPGGHSFHLISCLGGSLKILADGQATALSKGETALIPASLKWALEGQASLLWSRP